MTKSNETAGADSASALTNGLERRRPSLVEFAEAVRGEKVPEYQRTLLEAIERGEKVMICQVTGRRYFEALCDDWKRYCEQVRSNAM